MADFTYYSFQSESEKFPEFQATTAPNHRHESIIGGINSSLNHHQTWYMHLVFVHQFFYQPSGFAARCCDFGTQDAVLN